MPLPATGALAAGDRRSASGKRTVNSLPSPRPALVARTSPPCRLTSPCITVSPRPIPPWARSRVRSAWVNGSNTVSSISGVMPTPVSLTRTTAQGPSAVTATVMFPPGGVYFVALVRMFPITCSMRTASTSTGTGWVGTSTWIRCWRARSLLHISATTSRTSFARSSATRLRAIFPDVTRATSSRSSTRWCRWWICRPITASGRCSPGRGRAGPIGQLLGAQHGGQRVAQLVAQHGQELIALVHLPFALAQHVPAVVLPAPRRAAPIARRSPASTGAPGARAR